MKHWGLEPNDGVFQQIFDDMDLDKDGLISYSDFKAAVGKIVNPATELIFRQQLIKKGAPIKCKVLDCELNPSGQQQYCNMHINLNLKKGQSIINEL
jgi:EF hand